MCLHIAMGLSWAHIARSHGALSHSVDLHMGQKYTLGNLLPVEDMYLRKERIFMTARVLSK